MIGRIIVFLMFVATALPLRAQNIEYISSTLNTGCLNTAVVSGSYAYCASEYALYILSINDITNPILIKAFPGLGGQAANLCGNYIYLSSRGDGEKIIDISQPINPVELSRFGEYSEDSYIEGSYAYLAGNNHGMQIIDVTNPFNPISIVQFYTYQYAYAVSVDSGYAFVADYDSGLTVYNVQNPYNPTQAAHYNNSNMGFHRFLDIDVVGNYAYIADNQEGLRIFDISNPASPVYVTGFSLPLKASRVLVMGNYAYLASGSLDQGCAYIVNITDPSNPVLISTYDYVHYPQSFYKSDSLLYIAGINGFSLENSYGLLNIINISEPSNPVFMGEYDTFRFSAAKACARGNYAYSGEALLYSVDYSNPETPVPTSYCDLPHNLPWPWSGLRDICVVGEYVYATAFCHYFYIISISEPSYPLLINSLILPDCALGMYIQGQYAYVTISYSGLAIVDISDPADPEIVATYHTEGIAGDIEVSGDYAYLTDNSCGLIVLDISDPTSPTRVGGLAVSGFPTVAVMGNYAYLNSQPCLIVADISNPQNPTQVGQYEYHGLLWDYKLQGDLAYLALSAPNAIEIIDISSPQNPVRLLNQPVPLSGSGIYVDNDYIYLATTFDLELYRFSATAVNESPPSLPESDFALSCYPNPFNSTVTINARGFDKTAIDIYDITGKKVANIKAEGGKAVWDASAFPSGVYFARLATGDKAIKMVLLK